MHCFDEPLEGGRTAVVGFHGENARWIVAPRQVAGELGQGHDFHDVHAQPLQIVEFLQGFLKLVRLPVLLVVKGSQVHFINHEFVDGRNMKIVAFPVKMRVVNNRVAHRTGNLARIRVDAQQLLVAGYNTVAILVADGGGRDIGVPKLAPLALHWVSVVRPTVKRARDVNRVGVGRPYTKRDARLVRGCPHSRVNFLGC